MNPRVKELAEQAGGVVLAGSEIQKFADLIIRECVGILEPKSRYMGEGPEVLKDKIRQIKRHFGVEL